VTEPPFAVGAVAVAIWVEPQRELDPILCVLLAVAYGVACSVRVSMPNSGDAPATQLIFVPMLLLAPLNIVPLLVLGGNVVDRVWAHVREDWPLRRLFLTVGNSTYALAPVLVLAVAGHDEFAWSYWPLYACALAAQLALNLLFALAREVLHVGARLNRDIAFVPSIIDVVLSLPALGVVAIWADAPAAAVLITAALLAIASGFTSERRHRLAERERAEFDARRAIVDERVRIARELHDVVAHHVSLVGVQAGATRMVLDRDPAKAKETLTSIESTSREAVRELHQLLGFLRQADDPDDLGPQPGLGRLDELASAMSGSELVVEVTIEGEPLALAPTVDASAYRIVQEALTNTLKHARASRAEVHLRYRSGEVEIAILDDGHPHAGGPTSAGAGLGLIGMRERAALHGGRLTTGTRAGGGFEVRATLPATGGMT
jgi:signal transduction histidine kinase